MGQKQTCLVHFLKAILISHAVNATVYYLHAREYMLPLKKTTQTNMIFHHPFLE